MSNARLFFWGLVVALLSAAAYGDRAANGRPPRDVLYRYETAIGSLLGYVVVGAAIALIAVNRYDLLALRRPRSWWRSLGLAVAALIAVLVMGALLDTFLHADREQGLTPPGWEPDKAGQYAANFVVVAGVAPVVEELLFRGLGYSLLERYGRWTAIVLVGLTFAAVHGLVSGFVVLAIFGAVLAWLRSRTGSVVPGMLVHGTFNAIALILAVAT